MQPRVQLIIQVQSDAALAVRNSAVRRFRGQTLNVICSSEFQHVRTTIRKKPWGRKRCVLQFRWWITRSRLERYPGGSSNCSRFLMCNSEAVPSDLRPDFVIERSTNVCVASWSPRGQWQWRQRYIWMNTKQEAEEIEDGKDKTNNNKKRKKEQKEKEHTNNIKKQATLSDDDADADGDDDEEEDDDDEDDSSGDDDDDDNDNHDDGSPYHCHNYCHCQYNCYKHHNIHDFTSIIVLLNYQIGLWQTSKKYAHTSWCLATSESKTARSEIGFPCLHGYVAWGHGRRWCAVLAWKSAGNHIPLANNSLRYMASISILDMFAKHCKTNSWKNDQIAPRLISGDTYISWWLFPHRTSVLFWFLSETREMPWNRDIYLQFMAIYVEICFLRPMVFFPQAWPDLSNPDHPGVYRLPPCSTKDQRVNSAVEQWPTYHMILITGTYTQVPVITLLYIDVNTYSRYSHIHFVQLRPNISYIYIIIYRRTNPAKKWGPRLHCLQEFSSWTFSQPMETLRFAKQTEETTFPIWGQSNAPLISRPTACVNPKSRNTLTN